MNKLWCLWLLATTAALLSVSLTGTLHAQTPVRMGSEITGAITEEDPEFSLLGGVFRPYVLRGRAGVPFRVSFTSPDGDLDMFLARTVAGVTDFLEEAMAVAGEQQVLVHTPDVDGDYLLIVWSTDYEPMSFSFLVEEISPEEALALTPEETLPFSESGPIQPLPPNRTIRGSFLGPAIYTFDAIAGELLEIGLESDDFDTYVEAGVMLDGEFLTLDSDDDEGTGTNSLVEYFVDETGQHAIRVSAYDDDPAATGDFYLHVRPAISPLDIPTRDLFPGQVETAVLSTSELLGTGLPLYDQWALTAEAGDQLIISLASDDFDPYLAVGRLVDGRFEEIWSNDDDGDSLNSLISFEPTETDRYLIRASARGEEAEGEYTLLARPRPRPRLEPQVATIEVGERVVGLLDETDARLQDDSPHDRWIFQAVEGRVYRITLRSEDFDAYLEVGRMVGERFRHFYRDDDGAGEAPSETDERGADIADPISADLELPPSEPDDLLDPYEPATTTDARVTMIAPVTGEFIIHVTTFGAYELGNYELVLEEISSR